MLAPIATPFRPLRRPLAARPAAGFAAAVAAVASAMAALPAHAAEIAAPPAAAAPSLVDVVTHSPTWVWFVLIGLVWLGLKRTQDREVGLGGLVLLPGALILLSLHNALGSGAGMDGIAGLVVGAMFGIAAGVTLERRYVPTPLGGGRLRLRGEWTSLVVVLAVFLTRYVEAVVGAVAPATARSDHFMLAAAGISGFFAAMLAARAVIRLRLALGATPTAA